MDQQRRQVGKNQPCPCGSGKKYKLCCIWKERQERKVESSVLKCEHGHPLVADFTENPLFQALNYERPLRYFAREQGLYLFSTLTVGIGHQLLEDLDAGVLTKDRLIDAYRSSVSRELAMRVLAKGAQNFNTFATRHPILRDGFRAHFNRAYNLSIPCLLPQIEGMLGDLEMSNSAGPAIDTAGYDRRLAFETQDHAAEFNAFLSELFRGRVQADVFNRNPILHGANPHYGREEWSLIIVLTILEIHYFLWFREKLPVVVP